MRRGEIYHLILDPIRGREQSGRRPVVVVSVDAVNALPLVVVVVPGTDGAHVRREKPHNVRVSPAESGRPKETVFLCPQVRGLDPGRFLGRPAACYRQPPWIGWVPPSSTHWVYNDLNSASPGVVRVKIAHPPELCLPRRLD